MSVAVHFSLIEALRSPRSSSSSNSISAHYRHFADRDELLAACATAACEAVQRDFEAALDVASARAAGATRALLRGRSQLF